MLDGISVGGMLWRLHRLLVGASPERFQFECRRCGRTIHQPRQHCPDCGAAEVARYDL